MSYFTFDYYQTRFLLNQKKIKDLYTQRLLLQDSLIARKDTIIKNYNAIISLKQEQLDSTNKSLSYCGDIVKIQKQTIAENKTKIRNKNMIIISLVGAIGATFFLNF
jgi:hypothetical protein